ncbi:1-deoxy-D-xylulose-5-phosphate synthase [Citrifermentans bemidjiense Bem]|uniref:1-deoxy-D-xylulose-5-phosphate synthase n=1 Tax=Citrifermentans bemidjiense (strain ATCC BAA-1014 / DSM 16622 / JCM 12645 / Bem) TaxID=404380 RepID=B5EI13_CITBB|nr:1-deoxy-D-xylulose-5-phosphate synthase [Citrifermentans bemidjiense]ACH38277.1 1-deoxy-D-xylulose-5-phosphate synthase [Citrifermentans bemidjiense Bem]
MPSILEGIKEPGQLKALSLSELETLAAELRERIIETCAANGGHLAPSLGVVELTIALHRVFDSPKDKIVWDVGHQAYAHKLLTGRNERFGTLRTLGGISGFPKRAESPHDCFDVGHSSTSISAGVGFAVARDLKGERNKVLTVIGDGSMTGGLALEGLNHAGELNKDLVVILNDNEMSISENVGALSNLLSRTITSEYVHRAKKDLEAFLEGLPMFGKSVLKIAKRAEESLKTLFTPGMLFEAFGFEYIGPIDGHDIGKLVETLENVKRFDDAVLIHVLTKKGKGYPAAEANPSLFHGVGPFDVQTGKVHKGKGGPASYTGVFGEALKRLAQDNEKIVAITAAMPDGTGLTPFAKEFPARFFDVGIAEQHAVTFAAGLAAEGFRPVVALYSSFLQRGFDQLCHDVCLQELPVVFAIDRAGVVGNDGPTHHGVFDLSYLRQLPGLTVMAPKDENELQHMFFTAFSLDGPSAVRYPRGGGLGVPMDQILEPLPVGKGELVREGKDGAILAVGTMVHPAQQAAAALALEGLDLAVMNVRFVKPLDRDLILSLAATRFLVTAEENVLQGGFGTSILELLEECGVTGVRVIRLGYPDSFVEQGEQAELKAAYGLDAAGIARSIREARGQSPQELVLEPADRPDGADLSSRP